MASDTGLDLVVRGATIVDGTGGPATEGDLAVSGGVIEAVGGRVGGRGAEEVDGRGLVLAPGFIDPHTHLDANLFWDPDVTPSSSFGVTTVVTANCGYSLAPLDGDAGRRYVMSALSTVEQIPEEAIWAGVPFDWDDLDSYSRRLDALSVALNHAYLVGHVPCARPRSGCLLLTNARRARRERGDGPALAGGSQLGALGFSTDQVIGNPGPGGTALPGQVCGEATSCSPWRHARTGARARAVHDGQRGPPPGPGRARGRSRLARASRRGLGANVVVGPIFDCHDDPGGVSHIMDMCCRPEAGRDASCRRSRPGRSSSGPASTARPRRPRPARR